MKCCGKDLGTGEPYVLVRYWCSQCNTEHLANATEMAEYIAKLHAEKSLATGLPDIL
jgi:hypothetical protein